MTQPADETRPADEQMASPEQLEELRGLAQQKGEDVPDDLRAAEAAQRIVELKAAG